MELSSSKPFHHYKRTQLSSL